MAGSTTPQAKRPFSAGLFAARMVGEAVIAGLCPSAVGVMLHAMGLAQSFASVPGARSVALEWAVTAGAIAGLGVAAGLDIGLIFTRSVAAVAASRSPRRR